jgi:hypothetical protein
MVVDYIVFTASAAPLTGSGTPLADFRGLYHHPNT